LPAAKQFFVVRLFFAAKARISVLKNGVGRSFQLIIEAFAAALITLLLSTRI
jgi:hypothetical protein